MKGESRRRSDRTFRALEGLLGHMHPKQDAHAAVEVLQNAFVSAGAMLAAPAHMLERNGLHPHDALLLSKLPELNRRIALETFGKRPKLDRFPLASAYLTANYHGAKVERFYMLCLDARGRLMERVFLQEGTLDGALFSLKHVLAEVMRVHPAAVVISHNHPGGTLRPSQEDINCTLQLLRALTAVGIPLLDHVIIAGRTAVSMRENGYVPSALWLMQNPDSRLLRGWLCAGAEAETSKAGSEAPEA